MSLTHEPDLLIKPNNCAIPHYSKHFKQIPKPITGSWMPTTVINTIIRKHLTYMHID